MATRAMMLLLAACAATPPPPAPPPTRVPPAPEAWALAKPLLKPRPAFDPAEVLPDPTPELRWPLTVNRHPELVPQFPIAAALADPGIDWIELCRRGAHNRNAGPKLRDQLEYLRAWCAIGRKDIDIALTRLASLTRSVVLGMSDAARSDIVHLIVDQGGSDDSLALLAKHRLTDLATLDLLAATYVEVGRPDDSYEVNERAIAADDRRKPLDRCQRLTRRIVLRPEAYRSPPMVDGAFLFDVPRRSNERCDALHVALECWLSPASRCDAYFKLSRETAELVAAFYAWPESRLDSTPPRWLEIAKHATKATAFPQGQDFGLIPTAYDFAVTALENAAAEIGCKRTPTLPHVRGLARILRDEPNRPQEFAQRLHALTRTGHDCRY